MQLVGGKTVAPGRAPSQYLAWTEVVAGSPGTLTNRHVAFRGGATWPGTHDVTWNGPSTNGGDYNDGGWMFDASTNRDVFGLHFMDGAGNEQVTLVRAQQ